MEHKERKTVLSTIFLLLTIVMLSADTGTSIADPQLQESTCDTPTDTLHVKTTGFNLFFEVNGQHNPDVKVEKGACLEVTMENMSEGDHTFIGLDDDHTVPDRRTRQ